MTLYWQTAAAVLLAVILGLTLEKQGKDIGVLLTIAVCCMGVLIALAYLDPVLDFLRKLETLGNLDGRLIGVLFKVVGIGLVSEIAGMICTDAGKGSLGKSLQMVATAVILWLSLPIFTALIDLIQTILGGI
jgi:stage III sporulation protein AD